MGDQRKRKLNKIPANIVQLEINSKTLHGIVGIRRCAAPAALGYTNEIALIDFVLCAIHLVKGSAAGEIG
ncbi:hypothetical protein D3C75_968330 [compost metagenome]